MIAVVRHATHSAPARALRAAAGAFLSLGLAAAAQDAAPDASPAELAVPATNVLAVISARYAAVSNVSCTVRRGLSVGGKDGGSAEAVSRIVWARGGFLNAQKIAPDRRRTVIDGTTVRTAPEDEKEPICFPVADQLPTQAANLRAVPGSPEESLSALDPATAEEVLPPAAPFARQIAFRFAATNAPNAVAVVLLAADGSVARLEAFDDDARSRPAWSTEFLSPIELLPGVPFFRRIETTSVVDGRTVRATTSCDRLRVNEELPPSVFDPKAFF